MSAAAASRRLIPAVLGVLATIVGCSSSPPAKLYTLASRPGSSVNRPATVTVRTVEIAKYLDRPEIARYSDAYQLSTSEFSLWGEPLTGMITRVLVENIAERLPQGRAYAASGPLSLPSADYTVEVNIDKFDADPGGAVVLRTQWVLHHGKGRDEFRADMIRVPTSSDEPAAQVAAMSDALGQLADEVVAGIMASGDSTENEAPRASPRAR